MSNVKQIRKLAIILKKLDKQDKDRVNQAHVNYIKECLVRKITGILFPFTRSIIFGNPNLKSCFINGTITFIKTTSRCFGVTCFHVIDAYQKNKRKDSEIVLQIGDMIIDNIGERIIDKSEELDLITLDFLESDITKFMDKAIPFTYSEESVPLVPMVDKNKPIWVNSVGCPHQLVSEYDRLHKEAKGNPLLIPHTCLLSMPVRGFKYGGFRFILKFRNSDQMGLIKRSEDIERLKHIYGMSGSGAFVLNKGKPKLVGILTNCDKKNLDSFMLGRYFEDLKQEGIPEEVLESLRSFPDSLWKKLNSVEESQGVVKKEIFLKFVQLGMFHIRQKVVYTFLFRVI